MKEIILEWITENMLLQVDSEGNHFLFLKEITDHLKDASPINKTHVLLTRESGNLHAKKTTIGCTLQVEWYDGSVE